MTKNTIYIVAKGAAKEIFDAEFAAFQQGQGEYYDSEFSNWGAIRYSLDGTQVLLEEEQHKFKPEHLTHPDVHVYTEKEVKKYLDANKADWQEKLEV